jgi:hypothetical protein
VKRCPFCAEEILDAAKKCRFCGEWLESDVRATAPAAQRRPKSIREMLATGELQPDLRQLETLPGNLGLALQAVNRAIPNDPQLMVWHCNSGEALVITSKHLALIRAGAIGGNGTATVIEHDKIQALQLKRSSQMASLHVGGIDIAGSPTEYPFDFVSINWGQDRLSYALALLSLIHPVEGVDVATLQEAVSSHLGTAAAVAGGVLAGEVLYSMVGPDTVTTTIETVASLTGDGMLESTSTITSEVAGGIGDFLGGLFS